MAPKSSYEASIEKITDEKNAEDNWGLIMEVVDSIGSSNQNSKDCVRLAMKKVASNSPRSVLQALTLLDACVSNCGKVFHLELNSKAVVDQFKTSITKGTNYKVSERLRELVRKWSENEFKGDSSLSLIPSLYRQLKDDGFDFIISDSKPKSVERDHLAETEEENLMQAIAISLAEEEEKKKKAPQTQDSALYPSLSVSRSQPQNVRKESYKVRALYDFQAAEDNELTFTSGTIIFVLDDSDPNWWKGSNHNGEGLFPANFVTLDLNMEVEPEYAPSRVNFQDDVIVAAVSTDDPPVQLSVDEAVIDRCLDVLQGADPTGEQRPDPPELLVLEGKVKQMSSLLEKELDKVDRRIAKLGSINGSLTQVLDFYNTLMRSEAQQQFSYHPMTMPAYNTSYQSPNPATNFQYPQMPPNRVPFHESPYFQRDAQDPSSFPRGPVASPMRGTPQGQVRISGLDKTTLGSPNQVVPPQAVVGVGGALKDMNVYHDANHSEFVNRQLAERMNQGLSLQNPSVPINSFSNPPYANSQVNSYPSNVEQWSQSLI